MCFWTCHVVIFVVIFENAIRLQNMEPGGASFGLSRSPYDIVMSTKTVRVVKGGREVDVKYFEGSWEVPREIRKRPRHKITGTSRKSEDQARERAIAKAIAYVESLTNEPYPEPRRRLKPVKIEIAETEGRTVKEYLIEWFNAQVASGRWELSSASNVEQQFNDYIYPYLGDVQLDQVTHEMARILFTETLPSLKKLDRDGNPTKVKRLGASAIKNTYLYFHMAIKAAKAKNWIDSNPAYQIHMPAEPPAHQDDDNIIALMDALIDVFLAKPDMDDQDTIRVAISFFAGLRRGERCALRWADLKDLDGDKPKMVIAKQLGYVSPQKGGVGHFITDSTKTGRPRKFPIPGLLVPYLQHQRKVVEKWKKSPDWNPEADYSDFVLTTPTGALIALNDDSDLIHKWMKKHNVSIPNFVPGDLRHASATWWVGEQKAKRAELKKMFGWTKDSEMDRYYGRVDLRPLEKKAKNAKLRRRSDSGDE